MENNKIPKIFHFIWITEDFMNERNNITTGHEIVINSFKKYNPAFDMTIWTNWRIQVLIDKLEDGLIKKMLLGKKISLVQKTDILRMLILNEYGGIYSDLDVLCISSFEDLLNNDFFVGEEKSKDRTNMNADSQVAHDMHYVNNTVMGSKPKSMVISKYLELAPSTKNIFRISYGPNLVENTLSNCNKEHYTILSQDYFFIKNYFTELDATLLTKNTKIVHFYQGTGKK